MSRVRSDFIRTLQAIPAAINEPLLVSTAPVDDAAELHNERARVLRNGIAISTFASLETYMRNRAAEALECIKGSKVMFGHLPSGLRRLATVGVVEGTLFKLARGDEEADVVAELVMIGRHLVSVSNSDFVLGRYMFGATSSNISKGTIKTLLDALGVKDGLSALDSFARRSGLNRNPLDAFKELADLRHQSAHVATADVSYTELNMMVQRALAVAVPFDAIVSRACRIQAERVDGGKLVVDQSTIDVWRLREMAASPGDWELHYADGTDETFHASDREDAMREARRRAQSTYAFILCSGPAGLVDWQSTDV